MQKEKQPNALTSKEDLSSPNLIKNHKERRGKDSLDIEGEEFYRQLEEDKNDLVKTDVSLQILLRRKMINLGESISSASEKINERINELEETQKALKGRDFVRDKKVEYDEIDDEFAKIMDENEDKIGTELEYLETTGRVIGFLLRDGMIRGSDSFIKAVEAVYAQIKKFTP